ncbi:uncharacterized protein LTR77_004500 [Saxophila tyrrhenica]|uniref:G-patch domain-containing protein n=1 Tax=Saxophila tyrrhenica TaxID=1690608 RepID=A0AAV9PD02_9PEZI|nr:hypothetical protein LTR77_004500 [Saxophila tyrrhenica]
MATPPTKPSGGGLSLYADLLEPDRQKSAGAGTISSAPVRYDIQRSGSAGEEDAAVQQKKKDASLKFQPIKRPQVPQKAKPKTASSSSSAHRLSSSVSTSAVTASSPDRPQQQGGQLSSTPSQQPPSLQKSNFEDWVGDGDDDFYYQDNRARGGRKKRKKNNKPQERAWDWDDIYDPTMPNNYADYKGSEEQHREMREWKARLYHHQMKEARRAERNGAGERDNGEQPSKPNMMFALPANLNFAPPSFDAAPPPPPAEDGDDYYPPPVDTDEGERSRQSMPNLAPPPAAFDNAMAGESYIGRAQMGGIAGAHSASSPLDAQSAAMSPPYAPPPVSDAEDDDLAAKKAEAQAKIAAFKAKHLQKQKSKGEAAAAVPAPSLPATANVLVNPAATQESQAQTPDPPTSIISRAPVRYEVPPPPPDDPTGAEDVEMADATTNQPLAPAENQQRKIIPGQKGFAERVMKKYGWEEGHGLGAQSDGIITALVAKKPDKRKKRSHGPDGKWSAPANMGKIVGGKKRKVETNTEEDDARFGKMSSVIKLSSMLDGLDVQHEIEENNIMQEIGDEMGGQYGNVERVFIWREAMGGTDEVFIKFTSQLSALRAVNAMSGTEFAGNEVKAQFWDEDKWAKEEYA